MSSLALEYKAIENCCESLESVFKSCERKIVNFLRKEGFIPEKVKEDVLEPRSILSQTVKAGMLVDEIKGAVSRDGKKFNVLIEYLRSDQFYEATAKSLSEELIKLEAKAKTEAHFTTGQQGKDVCNSHTVADQDQSSSSPSKLELPNPAQNASLDAPIATPHERIDRVRIKPLTSKSKQPQLAPSWKLKSARQYSVNREVTMQHRELAKLGMEGKNYIMITSMESGKIAVALVISDYLNRHKKFGCTRHVVYVTESKLQASHLSEALQELICNATVFTYAAENEVSNSIKRCCDISVWTAGKLLKEIKAGNFTFAYLGLMIFDECHHTVKKHPYAMLMELYLQCRSVADKMPQIIGITASPGTGEIELTTPPLTGEAELTALLEFGEIETASSGSGKIGTLGSGIGTASPETEEIGTTLSPGSGDYTDVNRRKALVTDHLLQLAARMDATAGYMIDRCRKTFDVTPNILKPRDISCDGFYSEVAQEMEKLERQLLDYNLDLKKHSEQYRAKLRKEQLALNCTNPRDYISTTKLLCCYSTALSLYMGLQQKDAVKKMMEHTDLPDDMKCTPCEQSMKEGLRALLSRVEKIYPESNPLLKDVRKILYSTFQNSPASRGIIFVCTKYHARGLCDWVKSNPNFKAIRPDVITGASKGSMDQEKQDEVIEAFRKGHTNLLIATSVAEEGLNMPDCNLVIRYNYVTSEISKIQAEGRARSENSHCYNFVVSDDMKEYKELKNLYLNKLADQILENGLPTGTNFKMKLTKIQNDIIKKRELRRNMRRKHRLRHESKEVKLLCRKCRTLACYLSDVYVYCTSHHVVPSENFKGKYLSAKHPEPDSYTGNDFERIEKRETIYCSKCEQKWGALFFWTEKGYIFPVIKCTCFTLELQDFQLLQPKKWSEVPAMEQFTDWLCDSDSDN